jgi:hypothetical protein
MRDSGDTGIENLLWSTDPGILVLFATPGRAGFYAVLTAP